MSSKPGTLMIVDDSADIRELMGRLYSRNGYNVILAEDGLDALKKLRACDELPCVILLDMMMSGMDGFAFRKEQVKDPRLSSIPTIVMTADANARDRSLQVGATGYIRKPADMDVLLAVAAKYCVCATARQAPEPH